MSSEDTPPSLYSAHEPVFPRRVKGAFRSLKWWIMGIALGIYYILPWIRWDRGPAVSDQAVLVDLANRRFFFFFIEIWPQEFYFVAGLLIMAGLGLFLFTSAAGRVWCGYACPQTVWTDLFILVERWVEGDRNARVRLHRQKWDLEKIRKRIVKWAIWLFIAVATGGAWVFYFADAPTLLHELVTFTAHPAAWITLLFLTVTTFLFGGFAREQICIYACPWPRIQAAMMDEDTLTIGYRDWRGEPRGKQRKELPEAERGDCIDCMACVNVCPMGIDIRNGQQLACITCGLCIDACNDVMDKIGKPRDLIGYMALSDEKVERDGGKPRSIWSHVLRPRTILYTVLWSGVGVAMIVALVARSDLDVNITPVRNPVFVTLKDGSIRNTYDLRIRNMAHDERDFAITLEGPEGLHLELEGQTGNIKAIPADMTGTQRVYVIAPAGSAAAQAARSDIRLDIRAEGGDAQVELDTVFNGKGH